MQLFILLFYALTIEQCNEICFHSQYTRVPNK